MTIRWLSLFVVLLLPQLAFAADVAVFAPEISNLPPQDADAVGGLIAQSYAAASQREVLAPAQTTPALQAGDYSKAAAQLSVKEYVRLSAMSAGRRVVITAGKYSADGQLLVQLRQTAENMEDVALVADSLARSLYSGVAQAAPPPFMAGQPISGPLLPPLKEKRKRNEMILGFKTGVHVPLAKGARYYPAISLQFNGRLQLERVFMEFGVGFILPTTIRNDDDFVPCLPEMGSTTCDSPPRSNRGHVGGITTEIGASYYLTTGNVAPYIGGGVIPRIVLAGMDDGRDERDIASMSVYAQVGVTFPRNQSTRFFVDLRVAQALLEQHLVNDERSWPTEPSLHAGLGW